MQLKINSPRTRWGSETVTISRIRTRDLNALLEAAKESLENRAQTEGVETILERDRELMNIIRAMENILEEKNREKSFDPVRINPRTRKIDKRGPPNV